MKIIGNNWIFFHFVDKDDLGAINFEARCKSGVLLQHKRVNNWFRNRGIWSKWRHCPREAPAVCGIKSRVDSDLLEHETLNGAEVNRLIAVANNEVTAVPGGSDMEHLLTSPEVANGGVADTRSAAEPGPVGGDL